MLVANALNERLTHFTRPRHSMPCQIFRRRPGGKLCVGRRVTHASLRTDSARVLRCKSTKLYDATAYTQFATWAVRTIRCRLPEYGYSKRVRRSFEALATNMSHVVAVCSVRPVGGPQARINVGGVSRFLSFAYFSLRRQRKVGA